jgi:hypothetical protein
MYIRSIVLTVVEVWTDDGLKLLQRKLKIISKSQPGILRYRYYSVEISQFKTSRDKQFITTLHS